MSSFLHLKWNIYLDIRERERERERENEDSAKNARNANRSFNQVNGLESRQKIGIHVPFIPYLQKCATQLNRYKKRYDAAFFQSQEYAGVIVNQDLVGDIAFIVRLWKSTRGAGNERLQRGVPRIRLRPDL